MLPDHFDDLVEKSLRRDLPIITTPHAREHLEAKKEGDEKFTAVYDLDFFESSLLNVNNPESKTGKVPAIKVTGMPGKHVPPGPLAVANDLLGAVPPTNGWMVELGYKPSVSLKDTEFTSGYRIYISGKQQPGPVTDDRRLIFTVAGDTLMIDELKEIPERYAGQNIDLMLVHLGGTTIPSPSVPLLMVSN